MRTDSHDEILAGIQAYLHTHFPGVEFSLKLDPDRKRVLFEGGGRPRYRLEVTHRFLEGEAGTATSLQRVQQWDVAGALRAAKTKMVTLATTGLHTAAPRHWAPVSPRR